MTDTSRKAKAFNDSRTLEEFNSVKMCNHCGEAIPLETFQVNSRNKDGRSYTCKTCKPLIHVRRKSTSKKRTPAQNIARAYNRTRMSASSERMCSVCNTLKDVSSYRSHTSVCVDCETPRYVSKITPSQQLVREYNSSREDYSTKMCSSCLKVLPKEAFHNSFTQKDATSGVCKVCGNLKGKKYKSTNRAKVLAKKIATSEEGRQKSKESEKRYKEAHPERIKQTQLRYREKASSKDKRKAYRAQPHIKAKSTQRGILRHSLDALKQGKYSSSFEMLGYTSEDLLAHLNTGEYTWEDYMKNTKGTILFHVDHIIPTAVFARKASGLSTDEERYELMKKCNSLRNLRVWPAYENVSKSDSVDLDLIKQHGLEDLYELVK